MPFLMKLRRLYLINGLDLIATIRCLHHRPRPLSPMIIKLVGFNTDILLDTSTKFGNQQTNRCEVTAFFVLGHAHFWRLWRPHLAELHEI